MRLHPSHIAVGDNEFVETLGLEFDDVDPGLVIEHRPGFSFSWAEARYRATIAGDHSPVLMDPTFAACAGGGAAEISQAWILGAFAATTTRAFGRVVANLAWENVSFAHPIRDGDMVFAESTILGKRETKSRPDQGILHVQTRGIVRGGSEVCRYERKLLVYRSSAGPHRAAGYV
ncbi:MAG: MaoC/PaaZ C-terminal domain-containing protein [Phaeovulum sp.]|uniref:MaoC/PaaZ C-terminal domain-containing protein n=1 Tax=Phaeovulum sp. TaxID=2934796 RepID=UPI0027310A24|nr:MaoC/PaaZ C-terminal domain-containing protein [Phaeovulum sp.]MDP2063052.1 MaoC/PaaZ C-terminal domain-containing protein [Phaeovulum sp.]